MSSEFVRASDAEWKDTVIATADEPIVQLAGGVETHILAGKNMTLSFATLAPQTYAPVHSHPHEQMMIIVKGEMDAIVDGKYYRVKPGNVVPIPGHVPHGAQTLEETVEVIEVFSPARKDFEEKLQAAKSAAG